MDRLFGKFLRPVSNTGGMMQAVIVFHYAATSKTGLELAREGSVLRYYSLPLNSVIFYCWFLNASW